jgi:hypothetical protein
MAVASTTAAPSAAVAAISAAILAAVAAAASRFLLARLRFLLAASLRLAMVDGKIDGFIGESSELSQSK